MRLIGLCGRSGSGKSECGRIIADMGIAVIDTDSVYRRLTQRGSELLGVLAGFFGEHILDASGNLDRKRLAQLVFGDDRLLSRLNEITHKHIIKGVLEQTGRVEAHSREGLVVVQAPLLFESGFDKKCEITICVVASDNHCINRLRIRDSITEEQARIRLSKQKDNSFLERNCDYIIINNEDFGYLKQRTEEVLGEVLRRVVK